ncbi:MAG: GNAT family N-acetyltransferase, partial [Bacilli bacterium]
KDFTGKYLPHINVCWLVFSEQYIEKYYDEIIKNRNVIEYRGPDIISKSQMIADNKETVEQCEKHGCVYHLIDQAYDVSVDMDIVLSTERLHFRRIRKEDEQELCKILQDEEIMYAWEHGFSAEEVKAWMAKNVTRYINEGFSYWAAIEKETGHIIGLMGPLVEEVCGEQHVGVAYILDKAYWHKGYATEGVKGCIMYAFDALKAHKVIAQIRPENTASRRVAESLGMTVEREIVKVYKGKEMPHLIYTLSRDLE